MSEIYTPQELGNLYARAGVYYEMHGDIEHALGAHFTETIMNGYRSCWKKQALLHPGWLITIRWNLITECFPRKRSAVRRLLCAG